MTHMPVNRKHARLVSYRSISKYCSSSLLSKKTLRSLSMSGCNSPKYKRLPITRRRHVDKRTFQEISRTETCSEQLNGVVFPSTGSEDLVETSGPPDISAYTMNITVRKSHPCYRSAQYINGYCSREQCEASSVAQNELSEADDAVRFVKEIRKSKHSQSYGDSGGEQPSLSDDSTVDSRTPTITKPDNQSAYDARTDDVAASQHRLDEHSGFKTNDHEHIEDQDVIDLSSDGLGDNDDDDDDDLVFVSSTNDMDENISRRTLRRIVRCVVSHFLEESDPEHLTLQYVLGRLHRLYHCDFNDRISEIESYIERALSNSQSPNTRQSFQEIRPGVRHADIDTLSSDNWLNDVIINRYMTMLVDNGQGCAALSSFWLEELQRGKEPVLPENWKAMGKILAPVCILSHWSLLAYSPSMNTVELYSSLPATDDEAKCGQVLLNFLSRKFEDPGIQVLHVIQDLPNQENVSDCGVYVCMFARCIVCGNSFNISPDQVTEFRYWLRNEILRGRLFNSEREIEE